MKLSNNFYLEEFLFSKKAIDLSINNSPSEGVVECLELLCKRTLQPIRDIIGVPIMLTSGYRSEKLNKAVNGHPRSHHLFGMAADIKCHSIDDNMKLCKLIEKNRIPYTQMILEYYSRGGWVHISYQDERITFRNTVIDYGANFGIEDFEDFSKKDYTDEWQAKVNKDERKK